jgi:hypothetical protein
VPANSPFRYYQRSLLVARCAQTSEPNQPIITRMYIERAGATERGWCSGYLCSDADDLEAEPSLAARLAHVRYRETSNSSAVPRLQTRCSTESAIASHHPHRAADWNGCSGFGGDVAAMSHLEARQWEEAAVTRYSAELERRRSDESKSGEQPIFAAEPFVTAGAAHDLGNYLQVIASAVRIMERSLSGETRAALAPVVRGANASLEHACCLSRRISMARASHASGRTAVEVQNPSVGARR